MTARKTTAADRIAELEAERDQLAAALDRALMGFTDLIGYCTMSKFYADPRVQTGDIILRVQEARSAVFDVQSEPYGWAHPLKGDHFCAADDGTDPFRPAPKVKPIGADDCIFCGRLDHPGACPKEVHVGWDGRNQSIIELEAACGCRFTRDGSRLIRPCVACLKAAH